MNQSRFEEKYQEQWERFRQLLNVLESKATDHSQIDQTPEKFPRQYRQLCNHYGLAQARHYSPAIVDRLHKLVLRGHRQLYKRKTNLLFAAINFIARDFPRSLRQNYIAFWVALVLFYGPAVAMGVATYHDPALIYSVMDEAQVLQMESMYNPEKRKIGRSAERDSETDLAMFGFYILNNVSIGFRTFAGGIIFGVGSVFFLLFNGTLLGGVAGHLSHPPFVEIFWQFVSGHGAFELTAIVISGAAGLMLGHSLICPGNYRRVDSLRLKAPVALRLVIGAALMLVCAAFVEAFWSSSMLSATLKFSVAAGNWTLVILYLLLAGRRVHES